jgi:hypothetical protein
MIRQYVALSTHFPDMDSRSLSALESYQICCCLIAHAVDTVITQTKYVISIRVLFVVFIDVS